MRERTHIFGGLNFTNFSWRKMDLKRGREGATVDDSPAHGGYALSEWVK